MRGQPPLGHEPSVLVVDRDRDSRELLAEVLAAWGCAPDVADGGVEALRLARRRPPRLVVSELMLEDLELEELVRTVRTYCNGPAPAFVALTACSRTEDRRRALQAGFDHYLLKPADLVSLRRLVSALV